MKVPDLEAAGFRRARAEAIVSTIGRSGERAATKGEIGALATKAELEMRLRKRLHGTALALTGAVVAGAGPV